MDNQPVFRPMRAHDSHIVSEMMKKLYQALQAPAHYMTDEKTAATFKQLSLQPGFLQLDVFEIDGAVVGYALLFKFWYNEFGGMVWNIDELFVQPEFQSKGIASRYVAELSKRKGECVALQLEVLPENKNAYSLYRRMGFEEKDSVTLYKLLA